MKSTLRLSDLITTSRIFTVAIFAAILCFEPKFFGIIPGIVIILFVFFTDTLDGIVARKLKEEPRFGAFYDIVGDRVAETVLLIPFVIAGVANPLILIYFIVKNALVDYLRFTQFALTNSVPFKQVRGKVDTFLVSSRFMRALYGSTKMLMIFLFYAVIFENSNDLRMIAETVGWLTIVVSSLRIYPTFKDYFKSLKRKR